MKRGEMGKWRGNRRGIGENCLYQAKEYTGIRKIKEKQSRGRKK
jgi:hypothetical protein